MATVKIAAKTMKTKSNSSNLPYYPEHRKNTYQTKTGGTPIPKNFFVKEVIEDVFGNALPEERKFEQFFWTKQVVERLMKSLEYVCVEKTCCLTTPSLAHQMYIEGRDEVLLDIDRRFEYLPKFRYYDVRKPESVDGDFRLLILDPPFFVVPIEQFREAVDMITGKNYKCHLIIGFLKRGEYRLRKAFEPYNLVPTKFPLEYAAIKPSKWDNFVLYSNIDLPGIKRIKE